MPVDVVNGQLFVLPTYIFELCRMSIGKDAPADEWMYEISSPNVDDDFKKKFRVAFTHYAEGDAKEAQEKIAELMNSGREAANAIFPHVGHHLERLHKAAQTISSSKQPVRQMMSPWVGIGGIPQ